MEEPEKAAGCGTQSTHEHASGGGARRGEVTGFGEAASVSMALEEVAARWERIVAPSAASPGTMSGQGENVGVLSHVRAHAQMPVRGEEDRRNGAI